jgi:hypothetical protein
MSSEEKELFEKITKGVELAVKRELDKIRDSSNPVIAVCRDGKTIEFINLREEATPRANSDL